VAGPLEGRFPLTEMGATMYGTLERYHVQWFNADGTPGEKIIRTRLLATDLAVLRACKCTGIHWTKLS